MKMYYIIWRTSKTEDICMIKDTISRALTRVLSIKEYNLKIKI